MVDRDCPYIGKEDFNCAYGGPCDSDNYEKCKVYIAAEKEREGRDLEDDLNG